MLNLIGQNRESLDAFFTDLGEKRFRTDQTLKWMHQHGVSDFFEMTNLSRKLREQLTGIASVLPPEVMHHQVAKDGTQKWVLRVDERNAVEMVYIPEPGRGTLCISSQAGCALNCAFCSTAQQGFNRNLTSSEIVGQLWLAEKLLGSHGDDMGMSGSSAPAAGGGVQPNGRGEPVHARRSVTNVVMMGMGEPLMNLDNVVPAMQIMLDDHAYGLSRRRVTLSTAGVVPALDKLRELCPVALAVSLHAPNDELRDRLVPINRTYPIARLLDACARYADAGPRPAITFEYVMIDGVNDDLRHARELADLLRGLPAKLNLIPFNPFPGSSFKRSPEQRIEAFKNLLQRRDLITTTRRPRGDDIDAACGQLVGDVFARSERVRKRRGLTSDKMPVELTVTSR